MHAAAVADTAGVSAAAVALASAQLPGGPQPPLRARTGTRADARPRRPAERATTRVREHAVHRLPRPPPRANAASAKVCAIATQTTSGSTGWLVIIHLVYFRGIWYFKLFFRLLSQILDLLLIMSITADITLICLDRQVSLQKIESFYQELWKI